MDAGASSLQGSHENISSVNETLFPSNFSQSDEEVRFSPSDANELDRLLLSYASWRDYEQNQWLSEPGFCNASRPISKIFQTPRPFLLQPENVVAGEKNSSALVRWEQYPWSPEVPEQWGQLSNGVSTDEIINQQIMISGTDCLVRTHPSSSKMEMIPAYLAWENAGELHNKRTQCPGEAFFNNARTEFPETLALHKKSITEKESDEEKDPSQHEQGESYFNQASVGAGLVGLTALGTAWVVEKYRAITRQDEARDLNSTNEDATVVASPEQAAENLRSDASSVATTAREDIVVGADPTEPDIQTPRRPAAQVIRNLSGELDRAAAQNTTPLDDVGNNTWKDSGGTDEDHSYDD